MFTRVVEGPPGDAERLAGLTVPGLANCHSHAFHRALRGRTQRERGTFWTWREQMYAVAATLTPDSYFELARATYREMAAVGITSVGEFHYLHHGPGGTPYDDPNAMSDALVEAAREAGIRIALLDTCYLTAGIGRPPEGVQQRFSDGDADAWAARLSRRAVTAATTRRENGRAASDGSAVRWGAAIHSVRAVPRDQMPTVAAWAEEHQAPLHVHLSEQVAENDACRAAYGATPTEVLDAGRRAGPAHHRRARHPPDRLRRRPARRLPHPRLLLPHHRARPRRRHRPVPAAARGRRRRSPSAPTATRSSTCSRRCGPSSSTSGSPPGSAGTGRPRSCSAPRRTTGTSRSASTGWGGSRSGPGRTWSRSTPTTVRTAGTGADAGTAVFAASGADVVRVLRDGVDITRDPADLGAELDRVIRRLLP